MANYFVVCLLIVAVVIQVSESAPTYQVLEARPGYVPVYIRMGDEPLENINPDLAAAFGRTKKSEKLIASEPSPSFAGNPDISMPPMPSADDAAKAKDLMITYPAPPALPGFSITLPAKSGIPSLEIMYPDQPAKS